MSDVLLCTTSIQIGLRAADLGGFRPMLDSADLYLTKPSGISVTEAKTKRLPMVFVDAVAGCEEYNRSFFVESGGAVSGQNTGSLAEICMGLMRDALKRKQMTESFDSLQYENSSQYICDYLNNKVLTMRSS